MNYPKDRFDDIPPGLDRRGAHRAPRTRLAKLASWLWGLLAVVVIVAVAAVAMQVINGVVSFSPSAETEATETPTEEAPVEEVPAEVVPQLDPNVSVRVLNGTELAGVAGGTTSDLTAAGWNVTETADAPTSDYATTTVSYNDASQEAAALALVQSLGGGTAVLDPNVAAAGTIVVIVGLDLAG